jgi:hypothetical protein
MVDSVLHLIELGAAGAVIAVVIIFLNYIAKRDKEWQDFFNSLTDKQVITMLKLVDAIAQLQNEFNRHDVWEHTLMSAMEREIRDRHPVREEKGQ